MGLLTVSNKLEKEHPEIISITLRWLEKECNAQILNVVKGLNTIYLIEGDDIPKGEEKFDVIFKKIVPGVFSIRIESIISDNDPVRELFPSENKKIRYFFSSN